MNVRRQEGQALLMTVLFLAGLLGMAALVLDVGSWFREKRQLQATADAAALAGAQVLPGSPASATALAVKFADANGGGVSSSGVSISSGLSANDTITVQAKSTSPGFFSRVLGVDVVDIGASAAARAALPQEAMYAAPMVVSDKHPLLKGGGCPCFGDETTLPFDPLGAPGAFGMLDLAGDGGAVGTSAESAWILHGFDKYLPLGWYDSDPGAKFSSSDVQGALQDRVGTVLLFPVFHVLTGTGSNAQYEIVGWVGFHLDSYTVHGNNATLSGYFTTYIAKGIQATSGSSEPDFGVRTIQLIH
jgi:Putative Flp pilus-assembly TadE/G-like